MPTNQDIAANVRAEAARRQVTQAQLADRLGLKQPGMSRRMLGRVPFSASELATVADVLEIPVANLIGQAVA